MKVSSKSSKHQPGNKPSRSHVCTKRLALHRYPLLCVIEVIVDQKLESAAPSNYLNLINRHPLMRSNLTLLPMQLTRHCWSALSYLNKLNGAEPVITVHTYNMQKP